VYNGIRETRREKNASYTLLLNLPFKNDTVTRAQRACGNGEQVASDQFHLVGKLINTGKSALRTIGGYYLSRYENSETQS